MKLKKILAAVFAAAVAVSAMSVSAFAADDRDYTEIAAGNKMLEFEGIAGWGGGQWLIGTDNVCMDEPLTIADLEAYDHFEIDYTASDIPPALGEDDPAILCFIYKFATSLSDDGKLATSEAYLPDGWKDYGPTGESGNTYFAEDYFTFPAEESGKIIVKTADILNSIQVDKSTILYLWQFGLGTNSYKYDTDWGDENELGDHYPIVVSSVKLCAEPHDEVEAVEVMTTADENAAEETTLTDETAAPEDTTAADESAAPEDTTAASEETVAEETTAAETTAASAEVTPDPGFPVWAIICIAAGAVLIIIVVVIVIAKKKK